MNKYREKAIALWESLQQKYTQEYLNSVQFELGIDEAGRGPVFGSMIYSSLWWPIELKEELAGLGFNDSKALNEEQRQKLFQVIGLLQGKLMFFETKELTAELISSSMNNQHHHCNLNQLSHQSALELSRSALKQGFKIAHIYADTVGEPQAYTRYLRNNLQEYAAVVKQITVQPKADRDHKVVSASSICAKVTRDSIISGWKFRQNLEFKGQLGSGYPSDPKTKEWLQKNKDPIFGYPNIVRFSWNTSLNALRPVLKIKIHQKQQEKRFTNFVLYEDAVSLHQDIWEIVKS